MSKSICPYKILGLSGIEVASVEMREPVSIGGFSVGGPLVKFDCGGVIANVAFSKDFHSWDTDPSPEFPVGKRYQILHSVGSFWRADASGTGEDAAATVLDVLMCNTFGGPQEELDLPLAGTVLAGWVDRSVSSLGLETTVGLLSEHSGMFGAEVHSEIRVTGHSQGTILMEADAYHVVIDAEKIPTTTGTYHNTVDKGCGPGRIDVHTILRYAEQFGGFPHRPALWNSVRAGLGDAVSFHRNLTA